jgi:tRNA(Arg) A34 adenosine deaminase TadA
LNDEYYIRIVNDLAIKSAKAWGSPFAAILVYNDKICHKSYEISVKTSNPTLHAELNVIGEFCSKTKIMNLEGYTLYCNVEPCVMCSGAIHWAKISKVVFGMSQKSLNEISGGKQKPRCEDIINIGHKKIEIIGPISEEEGKRIFKEYPLVKYK